MCDDSECEHIARSRMLLFFLFYFILFFFSDLKYCCTQAWMSDSDDPDGFVGTLLAIRHSVPLTAAYLPLILIPPGKFLMGSPDNEPGSNKREGPEHEVEITRPFYLGVTEVTQERPVRFV